MSGGRGRAGRSRGGPMRPLGTSRPSGFARSWTSDGAWMLRIALRRSNDHDPVCGPDGGRRRGMMTKKKRDPLSAIETKYEEVRQLLALGKERGYISYDE